MDTRLNEGFEKLKIAPNLNDWAINALS